MIASVKDVPLSNLRAKFLIDRFNIYVAHAPYFLFCMMSEDMRSFVTRDQPKNYFAMCYRARQIKATDSSQAAELY